MRRTRARHVGRSVAMGATTPNRNGLVGPPRVGESRRYHVLGPRVQRCPDRAIARIVPRSPGAGEDLVGPPAEEECLGALVDLVHHRRGFVVEVRPSAALESAAFVLLWPAGRRPAPVNADLGGV